MGKASGLESPEAFPCLPDRHRAGSLQWIRRAGASFNRIVRLTGTGLAIVRKMLGS